MRTAELTAPVPTKRYVRTSDVMRLTTLRTLDSLQTLVKRGILPPPLKLSKRTFLWDLEGIQAALDRLAAEGAAAAR